MESSCLLICSKSHCTSLPGPSSPWLLPSLVWQRPAQAALCWSTGRDDYVAINNSVAQDIAGPWKLPSRVGSRSLSTAHSDLFSRRPKFPVLLGKQSGQQEQKTLSCHLLMRGVAEQQRQSLAVPSGPGSPLPAPGEVPRKVGGYCR